MAINFTNDQQNAINAKGTVLVSAAAGSGKTAVLSERVVRLVCDKKNNTSIDRLLIVTFTNASALEMRVRIGKELDARCNSEPTNSHILKQKMLLGSAKICTIDSFCIDLCRKYFNILGISPDFTIASEPQIADLKEKAVKDVLAMHFLSPTDDFKALCDAFDIYKGDTLIKKAIIDIYDFSQCMAMSDQWLRSAVDNYFSDNVADCNFTKILLEKAQLKLKLCLDLVERNLQQAEGTEFYDSWSVGLSETRDYLNNMLNAANSFEWDKLYSMSNVFVRTPVEKLQKGQNKEIHKCLMDYRDDVFKKVKSIAGELGAPASEVLDSLHYVGKKIRILVELIFEFKNKYFEYLSAKNLLSFGLTEQLALKLLCTEKDGELVPSVLSEEICKQYDEVLVDEYQDNNDLQDKLFFAISDSGKHLFMVGDVKQSIYGFRNANPDNFLRHKDNYPLYDKVASPCKVILKSNFRSRKGVCDFVNGICGQLMKQETCGMDYTDEDVLVAGATFPAADFNKAELLLTDYSESGLLRDVADAERVADYITEVMQEQPFLRVNDSDTQLRKADYKDFAILLRSPKSRVRYYINALKRRGIPVSYDAGEFFDSPEILISSSILKVINNPTNDIALLSSMTSVAFGFSYDDVANLRIKYGSKSLYASVVKAANDGDVKCVQMLDVLNILRTSAVTLSVSALIREMYSRTHLREILCSKDVGGQIKNNLQTLVTMASSFDSANNGGLSGFINYFDRAYAEKKTGNERSVKTCSNAVNLMSFHRSKGLQFPVCIVAGCGNGFNKMDINASYITDGKHGIAIKYVENGTDICPYAKKAIGYSQTKKLIAEEIRLFYVAATRAEERLAITVTSNNIEKDVQAAAGDIFDTGNGKLSVSSDAIISANGIKKMLLSAALLQKGNTKLLNVGKLDSLEVDGVGEYGLSCYKMKNVSREASGEIKVINAHPTIDSKTTDSLNERFNYVYPYSDECDIPSKMAVTKLVHGDSEEFVFTRRPRFMSIAGLTPAERGTALHKFMQFADYEKAEVSVEDEIKRLYEYEFMSEEEAASIDPIVAGQFFSSDLYKRMKKSRFVQREYKFMVNYPYKDHKTIIQGIADCIFEENGEIIIVDFKTDNIKDVNVLVERYAEQLKIYKYALTEIFKKNVKECVLYSVKLGKTVNV